jgi:hypothetical protein
MHRPGEEVAESREKTDRHRVISSEDGCRGHGD